MAVLLVTGVPGPARADWNHDAGSPYGNWYNPTDQPPTGTRLVRSWSVQLPSGQAQCTGPVNAPVVAGGRVIVRTGHSIDAYAPAGGKLLWRSRLNHWGPQPTDREWAGRLAVAGGRVLMLSTSCRHPASDPAYLTAMDERTGARKWRRKLDVYATDLVVDKGVAVVSAAWGTGVSVTAYRITDGKQLWRRTDGYAGAVSSLGRVLVTRANGRGAYAKNSVTGKTLWTTTASVRAVAANPGLFIVRSNGKLSALNAATGKVQWTGLPVGLFTLSGNEMFLSLETTMEVYDYGTGTRLRGFPVRYGQPLLAGGLIYVGQSIYDAATGAQVMTIPAKDGLLAHPVVWDGRVYTVEPGEVLRSFVFR